MVRESELHGIRDHQRPIGGEPVAVSCWYDTCFAVKTCDGLYHFIFSIDRVGIPFGFQPIVWTFVRHTVGRCLISSSYLRVYMGCALAVVFQDRSLYVPS